MPEERRTTGIEDPRAPEWRAVAARLAQHQARQALEAATGRMLAAARRVEQTAGTPACGAAYKAAANSRIAYDNALAAFEGAMRARMEAEIEASLLDGAFWLADGHMVQQAATMDRHVARWRTSGHRCRRDQMIKAALALASEAGEVAGDVEKWALRDGATPMPVDKLLDELGDVLFNLTDMAIAIGSNLEAIVRRNEAKWAERYPAGPTTKPSPLAAIWARMTGA